MMNESSEPQSGNIAASGRRHLNATVIGLLVVAAVTVLFVLQNREFVKIDFLFFEIRNRVWTAIAFSIGLGILLDRLIIRWWGKRKAAKNAQ